MVVSFCTSCDCSFVWMSQQQQCEILNVHRITVQSQYKTKQSQCDLLTKLCSPSLEFGFEVKRLIFQRAEMEKWAVSLWINNDRCVCVCVNITFTNLSFTCALLLIISSSTCLLYHVSVTDFSPHRCLICFLRAS